MSFRDELVYSNEEHEKKPLVNGRHEITFPRVKDNIETKQNYLDMNNIIVPIITRIGPDGQLYFAMKRKYIHAIKKVSLELPSVVMSEKKENYSEEDIQNAINALPDEYHLSELPHQHTQLSKTFYPVSQSFTNQRAGYVKEDFGITNNSNFLNNSEDKGLQWFPLSDLYNLIERNDIIMSGQSKHGLFLLAKEEEKRLKSLRPTKANINLRLLNFSPEKFEEMPQDREDFQHKHRFGVKVTTDTPSTIASLNEEGKIDYQEKRAVYGTSKNSVQVVLFRRNKENGKLQIGLADQQRSPFLTEDNPKRTFTETAAGMIDDEKDYKMFQNVDVNSEEYKSESQATKEILYDYASLNAAIRETAEEFGILLEHDQLNYSGRILLSQGTSEFSELYYTFPKDDYNYVKRKPKLDEQESISELTWYDVDSLDLENSPLPTIVAIEMALHNLETRNKETQDMAQDR